MSPGYAFKLASGATSFLPLTATCTPNGWEAPYFNLDTECVVDNSPTFTLTTGGQTCSQACSARNMVCDANIVKQMTHEEAQETIQTLMPGVKPCMSNAVVVLRSFE